MSDKGNSTQESSKIETYGLFFKAPIEYQTGKFGYVFRKDGVYVFYQKISKKIFNSSKTLHFSCPSTSSSNNALTSMHTLTHVLKKVKKFKKIFT